MFFSISTDRLFLKVAVSAKNCDMPGMSFNHGLDEMILSKIFSVASLKICAYIRSETQLPQQVVNDFNFVSSVDQIHNYGAELRQCRLLILSPGYTVTFRAGMDPRAL